TLISNTFGGGTINAERAFLTGDVYLPKFKKNTNSYIWYFNDQGYYTEASHPIYGWFYNRRNINKYLGFNNFYYYENYYSQKNQNFFNDQDYFNDIIINYEKRINSQKPYFHFGVTYQNHGPYSQKEPLVEWVSNIDKKVSKDIGYNIVNNYLNGIYDTNEQLYQLVEYFEKQTEPTILIFFGDHRPFLGPNNEGYNYLNIDVEVSNLEGFLNYYEVPYLIYGNTVAKDVFNKSFVGEVKTISPNYLMNELFEYLGWKGNIYNQKISEFKNKLPVLNNNYYKYKNNWVNNKNDEINKIYNDYLNVNYHYIYK
ncbi:MAG TPA: LTA synthase family protein, partial [Gallicola sp.]|nr:LTA synthase family protein [Gallicola sp.]